jgi:hypothetical protein
MSINHNLKSLHIQFVTYATKEIQKIVNYCPRNPHLRTKPKRKKKEGNTKGKSVTISVSDEIPYM